MAQITLIKDPDQSQRQLQIWQFLRDTSRQDILLPDYMSLVPSQRKVDKTKEWLLGQQGEQGWLPLVYTPSQLAHELYFKLGGSKRLLNDFTQRLILEDLLTQSGTTWEFINPDRLSPGLLKRISGFFAQIKIYGQGELNSALNSYRSGSGTHPKDIDLLKLFADYQQFLVQHSLADHQDVLSEVIKLLEDTNMVCQFLQRLQTLVIDGFYYYTPLEQVLIKTLTERFRQVLVSFDHAPLANKNQRLLDSYLKFWRELANTSNHTLDYLSLSAGSAPHDQSLSAIGQRLFQHPPLPPEPCNGLLIRNLPQRREEVRAIARDIRRIKNQEPETRLTQIYVVFPRMEKYAPLVQEIFPSYGISYEITKGCPLRSSPISRAVIMLLCVRLNSYQREDLCALFASELVSYHSSIETVQWVDFINSLIPKPPEVDQIILSAPGGEQHLNMPIIDHWARRANIQGGANWQQDWLAPLLEALCRYKANIVQKVELYCQLYLLRKAWLAFEQLPDRLAPAQFTQVLLGLIERFNIPLNIMHRLKQVQSLDIRDKQIILRREFKALDKFYSLLKELASALESVGKKEAQLPLPELYSKLLCCLSNAEYHLTNQAEERVQVVEPLELRGLAFDYLFWGGLTEEEFPRPEQIDFFYPSNKNHNRLFQTLSGPDEDRYLFSYIFKNTRRQITLSYPLCDQGKSLLPSTAIEELKLAVTIDQQKDPATFTDCYTTRELLYHIADRLNQEELPLAMFKALKCQNSEAYFQLLHILEVESHRRSCCGFSAYEGILVSSANLTRIKQLNQDARYTVTQMEDYAFCPLGYFFKHIIKILPSEEIVEDFEAQDRGRLLHKILENFYRRRIESYRHCPEQICITQDNLEEASRQMLQSAQTIITRFYTRYNNFFWQNEKNALLAGLNPDKTGQPAGLLRAFLEHEARSENKLIPCYLEFSFGHQGAAPALNLSELNLEGRIDRIDIAPDNSLAVIYDYKFGAAPDNSYIKQGLSFQLPVYIMAVTDFLKSKACLVGAGGYYQLKNPYDISKSTYFGLEETRTSRPKELGGKRLILSGQRKYGFLSTDVFKLILEQIKYNLIHVHRLINSGRFHPPLGTDDSLLCRFCDYDGICRTDPVRLAKMFPNLSEQEHYKPLRDE